ncbi:AhpC/TSA antioxidant enzyme-domain-containing protein [Lasiosphaeria hispida]|uniref:AhpC/TSA antioxidant enzyme-domain-containing protein n=1 Tax=Lasiosphaeria hispida TaxID=260671 RepID=A0AAJ0MHA8_9PEZI|nr:AhpC/TSA antioxidant enzyme-domain-containing protein [Lasiosphaeria hispida]
MAASSGPPAAAAAATTTKTDETTPLQTLPPAPAIQEKTQAGDGPVASAPPASQPEAAAPPIGAAAGSATVAKNPEAESDAKPEPAKEEHREKPAVPTLKTTTISAAATSAPGSTEAALPVSISRSSTVDGAADHDHDHDQDHYDPDDVNPLDFQGAVETNNELPSPETLARIENYIVLDRDGKSHSFKSLYTGKHVARRVLLIFVRHFFCGNCQEYLRALSASITPSSLLRLPISTFIAVIGCGDPGLIDMYTTETGCPFPVYADPRRKLYDALGMIRTLALGSRPAYAKRHIIKTSIESVVQGLKVLKKGLATKAGDARQIGGEFLFEPYELQSPVTTPFAEVERRIGDVSLGESRSSDASLDGKNEKDDGEEKRVTWCHRMKTTRDHAEIPELMEVLGLDGQGMPIKDKKRWSKAVEERKGTGLSMASQISAMKAEAGVGIDGTP